MNLFSGRIASVAVRAPTLRHAAVLCLSGVLLLGQAYGPFATALSAETAGAKTGTTVAIQSVNPTASFPAAVSGDYVYYRDHTWKSPTWVGFLYYDETTYGAVLVTPSTGTNVSVLFRVETVDGKMILTGQNVISQIAQKDVLAVNYLMGLLPDLYSWRVSAAAKAPGATAQSSPVRSGLLPPTVVLDLELSGFGGAVSLSYAPEVTLFNLQSMYAADGKPVLELARMGRIHSGEDSFFFSFTPSPKAKDAPAFVIPSGRKTEVKTVDGVKLNLDDQWTMVADNTFFLGDTAALIIDTIDLASVGLPQDNLVLSMVRLFSLSGKTSWADPSSFQLTGKTGRFRVENLFYDSGTGQANRDIKLCIPLSGGKCTVVSLSVADSAYQSNRAYFDALVQ